MLGGKRFVRGEQTVQHSLRSSLPFSFAVRRDAGVSVCLCALWSSQSGRMSRPVWPGYPHAFLASFALVVRCGLVLLVAIALRPAPSAARHKASAGSRDGPTKLESAGVCDKVKEHEVEVETRGKFDILLALRLCDFSCVVGSEEKPCTSPRMMPEWCASQETYLGAPMPAVIVVSGCGHALLNGEYRQARAFKCFDGFEVHRR